MGQKVNPNGFRVGVIKDWNTRWYASKKDFANFLIEDKEIRDYLKKKHYAPVCLKKKAFPDWGHEERRRNHFDHAAHIAGYFSNLYYRLIYDRLKGSEDILGAILIIGNQNLRVV